MSDYTFLARGQIDLSAVERRLEEMRNRYSTLNIAVNLTNLDGVERRLSNLTQQLQRGTSQVTGRMTTHLENEFRSINNLRSGLANMNFSGGSIGSITEGLERLDLSISQIRTNINQGGGIELNIRGLQDLNTVVNLTRTYDANGNLIAETNRQIVQSFDDGARAARAYNATLQQARTALGNNDMSAAISGAFKKLQELGATGHSEIRTVNSDLYEMRTILRNMSSETATDNDLVTGYQRFEELLQRVRNTLNLIANETGQVRQEQKIFNSDLAKAQTLFDSGKMSLNIQQLQSQYKALASTGNKEIPQLGNSLKRLEEIQAEMGKSGISNDKFVQLYREWLTLLPKVQNGLKGVAQAQKDANKEQQTMSKSATLSNDIETWLKKNTRAAKVYGDELRKIQNQLNNNKNPVALQNAQRRFEEIDSAASAAGLKAEGFLKRVKNIAMMTTGLWSTYQILMKCVAITKKMVQETINLDSAMGQLQIVTKATNAEMSTYYKNMSNTAKQIGASMTDLTNSATTYARLGYSMKESETLAKYTSMLKNVGDIDVTDTQNAMTALIKAYDLKVGDIETVMDKMVDVGEICCPAA